MLEILLSTLLFVYFQQANDKNEEEPQQLKQKNKIVILKIFLLFLTKYR